MFEPTNIALKEWSILCRELAGGRQVLLLKKGGIHDRRKEFEMDHRAFFLFPTYYHAKSEDVIESARDELDRLAREAPPEEEVHLSVYCEVHGARFVDDLATLKKLEGRHVYSEQTIDYRYNYRRPGLWVVTVRAYKLPKEVVVPNTEEYAGCVSWVSLDEVIDPADAKPALSDEAFSERISAVESIVGKIDG